MKTSETQKKRTQNRVRRAFSKVLREFRLENEMTQEELGFEAGCHSTFISQLERGLKQPSLATILILAKGLGIKPGDMVNAVDKKLASQIRIRLKKKSR